MRLREILFVSRYICHREPVTDPDEPSSYARLHTHPLSLPENWIQVPYPMNVIIIIWLALSAWRSTWKFISEDQIPPPGPVCEKVWSNRHQVQELLLPWMDQSLLGVLAKTSWRNKLWARKRLLACRV